MSALSPCTCGDAHPHEVAQRFTADGILVYLWSDGPVTAALGYRLLGVPLRRPRTPEGQRLALRAGWLFLGEVGIHDAADLGPVYEAAEHAARVDGLPGTLRRYLHREHRTVLSWTVLHADRDGRPTERVARLPRLRWPHLVVWDHCGGPGSSGGRYHLMERLRGRRDQDTVIATGFKFHRLEDLWKHLDTQGVESWADQPVARRSS